MKRITIFLLLLCVFILPSFASEAPSQDDLISDIVSTVDQLVGGDSDESDALDTNSDTSSNLSSTTNIIVSTPSYSVSELSSAFYKAILEAEAQKIDEFSSISSIDIQPLWTGDTGSTVIPSGTLRSVLNSVIGPYSPVVVQYQYTNGTNTQYLREIMPDYQWMISAGIFALVLYCVFRLWGSILCKR